MEEPKYKELLIVLALLGGMEGVFVDTLTKVEFLPGFYGRDEIVTHDVMDCIFVR